MIEWSQLPSAWESLSDKDSGVYFFIEGDRVAYIGRSAALRHRIRSHRQYRSELRENKWSIRYHLCSVSESALIEKACIKHYLPFRNVIHNGASLGRVRKVKCSPFLPKSVENGTLIPKDTLMNLAWIMKSWRHFNGLSMKEASEKVGIPSETYRRLEEGSLMRGETLAAVLRWILS
jgi:hypothetical protein